MSGNRSKDSQHIQQLRDQLGEHGVSYLAGEGTVRDVRRWAAGASAPREDVAARLRLAHQVLEGLRTASPERDAVAVFEQPLPQLGGYSTARLIRDAELERIRPLIFSALALPVVDV
jgi:hypothetical protein